MVIGLRRVGPEIDGELRLDAQQVAPLHGPIVGELGAFEEPVDEGGALGGVWVGQKLRCLLRGGQGANDIEESAADKYGVGREIGGLDLEALQAVEHACVDGRLRVERGLRSHRWDSGRAGRQWR